MTTIQSIYQTLMNEVAEKRPDVILEPAGTLALCCVSIDQKVLDKLTNEDFAKALYFKLLDRPPTHTDIRRVVGKLASRTTTRQAELDKVLQSPEYKKRATKHTIL